MLRKPTVTATLPTHVVEALEQRAALMEKTKSEYLALIAIAWFAKGCPAVNEHEERVRGLFSQTKHVRRAS